MDKRPLIAALVASLVVVLIGGVYLGTGARPHLGLDLQGGISAVYQPTLPEGQDPDDVEDFEEILDETIEVIRSRVDSAGVAEPDISRQGTNVLVQLPGVEEEERIRELIGQTAQLTFRPVEDIVVPGGEAYDEGPDCPQPPEEREELPDDEPAIVCGDEEDRRAIVDAETGEVQPPKYHLLPVALEGTAVRDAFPARDEQGNLVTSLDLDSEGGEVFAELTSELACLRDELGPDHPRGMMAIVLDGVVESASSMNPSVRCGTGIRGGSAQIQTGAGTMDEQREAAEDLALVLRTGALPITLEEATFQTVSATLGVESLRSGLLAGLLGLALVGLWMIGFYRWLGLVALAGLGVFGVLMMALISALSAWIGFALTLAGVAGIVVAVGITADSSIIFFERIRDEVNLGKTVRTGVKRAFDSAFRTNLAGNTVTLAAAAILYFLAIGPVRGFALMLGIATVIDVAILYLFTRPVVMLMGNTRLVTPRTVRSSESARAEARAARAGRAAAAGGSR